MNNRSGFEPASLPLVQAGSAACERLAPRDTATGPLQHAG
jgi:hypothetical protein